MTLVFDTETTNLPQHNLPLDHPAQARICQFAFLVLDDKLEESLAFSALIKPNGWNMQPGAQSVHGISQYECEREGVCIKLVLQLFNSCENMCDLIVAHNYRFDGELLDTERTLHGFIRASGAAQFCTMEVMTSICKLPSKIANKPYKWPKLIEAYKHCFNESFEGAHDALADVRATAKIYKWLVANNYATVAK